jgi:hypothetical protein
MCGLSGAKACCSEGLRSDQWGRAEVPGGVGAADAVFEWLPGVAGETSAPCAHVPIAQAHTPAANMGLINRGRRNGRIVSIVIFCGREL